MTGAGTVIRMKVNDGKLKCRRNYLQTDSWRSLSAAPSLHAFVRRQGQLRARSAVCPKAEKRLGGEAAFPVAGGGFWKLLKDAASRCIPRPCSSILLRRLFDGMGNRSIVLREYRAKRWRTKRRRRGARRIIVSSWSRVSVFWQERFDFGGEERAGVRMGRKKKTRSVIIDDR